MSDLLHRKSNFRFIWWFRVVSDLSPTLGKIGHQWFFKKKWYPWWQNQWFRLCKQWSHNSYKLFWRKNPQKILLSIFNFDLNVNKCPILPLFTVLHSDSFKGTVARDVFTIRTHLSVLRIRIRIRDEQPILYFRDLNKTFLQCCGYGKLISDLFFYPFRIQKQHQQQKFCIQTFFCSHKFHKNEKKIIFEMLKKKNLSQFVKNYSTFYPKNCH